MKINKIAIILSAIVFICTSTGYAQCIDNMHTPFYKDSWLSCEKLQNPNPNHPASHWIMYDLGYDYTLDSTYVWNYNVWGVSGWGMKDVIIDYSLDGQTWYALDTVQFPKADGAVKYNGSPGPWFENTVARYVLLTAINNWDGNSECIGLSEIKFGLGTPTSINPEIELEAITFETFPNPTFDKVTISINSQNIPDRVALYDLSGKLMAARTDLSSKNITMDMEDFPSAVYVVKVWVADRELQGKVVKAD